MSTSAFFAPSGMCMPVVTMLPQCSLFVGLNVCGFQPMIQMLLIILFRSLLDHCPRHFILASVVSVWIGLSANPLLSRLSISHIFLPYLCCFFYESLPSHSSVSLNDLRQPLCVSCFLLFCISLFSNHPFCFIPYCSFCLAFSSYYIHPLLCCPFSVSLCVYHRISALLSITFIQLFRAVCQQPLLQIRHCSYQPGRPLKRRHRHRY